MICKIAVAAANFAIDKPYSYFVPSQMHLQPGMRVMIPFGRSNRCTEGVVLSVEEGNPNGLKSVIQQLDDEAVLTDTMLRLAAFLRERYFCTYFDAVRTMLPAGLWFRTKQSYALTEDTSWREKTLRKKAAAIVLHILADCGGEAQEHMLRDAIGDDEELDSAIVYLLRKKWITAKTDYLRRTTDKTEKVATLIASAEEAMEYAGSRPKSAQMQRNVLELMCSIGSASVKEICYFTGAKPATLKRLEELGYIALTDKPALRCKQIQPVKLEGPLVLNSQQREALTGLQEQLNKNSFDVSLLYGVTGSGKTAVYIELIRKCLEQNGQAILLVPEIALTPQLLGLLTAHFEDKIAVLHSSLPAGERYDQWKRIRSGEARVVVGTRSAVFAPCTALRLIILDEEQEHSYKSENVPRYDAREVAHWRCKKESALLLFGSATPSIETMYYAKNGTYRLFTLGERYNGKPLPKVEIVDMHEQLVLGNDSSVSYPMQDAIGQTVQNKHQAILFLNRRGNSRALVCVDCRKAPECPRCNANLTYHSANERLMCHHCGYSQPAVSRCPNCGGAVKQVGTGTQKIQQELEMLFPGMQIARMDTDTVNAVNTHEKILDDFQKNETPVLVGTQMVAKGLNLPKVTLVGVLDADLGLYSDNFRGAETTFNMLTQVVGRAGRGDTSGRAMIQTMLPEHQVIQLAAKQDYNRFYDLEIGLRKMQMYPPFGDIAIVTVFGQDEASVLRGCMKLRESLRQCLLQPDFQNEQCTVLGPAPSPVPKINYNYRYRLTLQCKMTRSLRNLIAHLLRQFSLDRDNRGISAFIDVNGFD